MVDVEATFEYIGEQPDELSIKVGDIIKNVIQSEGGWWEGELKGKKGMFPDNFVKVLKDSEKEKDKKEEVKHREPRKDIQASKRQSVRDLANKIKDKVHDGPVPVRKKVKKRAKVVYAYEPENEDELRLSVGEMVDILKQDEEGWWEGIVNGKQGMMPSNFVEIVDESEPPAPEASEKSESTEAEGNMIKGKKIQGIGLGNIFGDGPIKLRSTTGKKPIDKPTEPPKVEKPPQEPFERRPKDAILSINQSANPTMEMVTNPTLLSEKPFGDYEEDTIDRDKDTHVTFQQDVDSFAVKYDLKFLDCDDVKEMDDISEMTNESDNTHNCNKINKNEDQFEQSMKWLFNYENDKTSFKLPKAPVFVKRNDCDIKQSPLFSNSNVGRGEYSDSLHTILDDLENCLDLSCKSPQSDKTHSNAGNNMASMLNDEKLGSSQELNSSILGRMYDNDIDFEEGVQTPNRLERPMDGNPVTPISKLSFNCAIDSVHVTNKRYSSDFCNPAIPRLSKDPKFTPKAPITFNNLHGFTPSISLSNQVTEQNTPTLILPSLKDPPRTNFASLNRSGNLSPFIQSIAHKYHIFNTPEIGSDKTLSDAQEDHADSDYEYVDIAKSTEGMEDEEDSKQVEVTSDEYHDKDRQGDIDKMVNTYIYDVLGTTLAPTKLSENEALETGSDLRDDGILSCMTEKLEKSSFIGDNDTEELDDDSVAVCLDENSIRLIGSSSKDFLDDILNEKRGSAEEFIDEPGTLICMTGGSSPDQFDQIPSFCSHNQSTPLNHRAPKQKSLNNSMPERPGFKGAKSPYNSTSHPIPWPKLPQGGQIRQTSSYCRISFNNDAPPFWFKKDFNESPGKESSSFYKARSPKRTISDTNENIPTLFALSERVYLDEFKGKVEAFKADNPQLVSLKEYDSPVDTKFVDADRSPSKKKRRKSISDSQMEHCKHTALNLNENAIQENKMPKEFTYIDYPLDDLGTVELFYGSKDDEPYYQGFQPASKVFSHQLGLQTHIEKKTTNLELEQSSEKNNLNNSAVKKEQTVSSPARTPYTYTDYRTKADYLLLTGTSPESVEFALNCSEQRKRRIFKAKTCLKGSRSPVKLLSFRKLDEVASVDSASQAGESYTEKPNSPPAILPAPKSISKVDDLATETKPVEKAMVRYSYKAENEDELSLNEGETITVLDKDLEDGGWWRGEVNGRTGVFPDNFVELIEEEVKPQVPTHPEKAPRPVVTPAVTSAVTPAAQPKPKRPQQPPLQVPASKPAPKLPEKAPVVDHPKPDPVKEEKPVVIPAKKPPPLTKKPMKLVETHEEKIKTEPTNPTGTFEAVEPTTDKLTHLTASRARGPTKRPPSQPKTNMTVVKEEERNGDVKDSHWLKEDKTAYVPPTLPERREEKPPHSIPVRPSDPPTVSPGIQLAIEELKREIGDLKTNTVTKSAFNELKADNEKLRQELDSVKANYSRRLKDIMAEVDDEKKIRLSTQVEIERIRKLVAESHV